MSCRVDGRCGCDRVLRDGDRVGLADWSVGMKHKEAWIAVGVGLLWAAAAFVGPWLQGDLIWAVTR